MPPFTYSHTQLSDAVSALAVRLGDRGGVYWTSAELALRIVQSLRMWQALTHTYRERVEFQTQASQAIFDLNQILPDRLGYSVTDQQLITGMQYSLLEPATGNSWIGTTQFNLAQATKALQRVRNQFLFDSGAVVSYSRMDVPPPPVGRVKLDDSVIDVRRLAWVDVSQAGGESEDGVVSPLYRDDDFSALSFNPGWPQNPGLPQIYSAVITPPVTVHLIPAPVSKGQLEMITVNSGPALAPDNGDGVLLSVPDDFSWAIEFGALAELLGMDGLSRDPMRAGYCQSLYRLGVEIAKFNLSVLMIQVDDELLYTGSFFDLDSFMPDWENTPGTPIFSAMLGRNLLALGPMPDGEYGVTLDIVSNMPVPVLDTDYLQIGREHLEAVLDMAQHLCALKQGGAEFVSTIPLQQNFLRMAGVQNSKLGALATYQDALFGVEQRQGKQVVMERGNGSSNANATV